MTVFTNSFDSITPSGTVITTGNSSSSGDPFTAVNGSPTADTTAAFHGAQGMLVNPSAVATKDVRTNAAAMANPTTFYARLYFGAGGLPSAISRTFQVMTGATAKFGLAISTAGQIAIRNLVLGANATSGTATTVFAASTSYRAELRAVQSGGTDWTVQLKLFVGANVDGLVPDETITTTGNLTGLGNVDTYCWGSLASAACTWSGLKIDSIGWSDVGYLGPWNASAADTSSGARLHGTDAVVVADTVATDASSGVRLHGSPATAAADVLVADTPGSLRPHGSPASVGADVVATDATRIGARTHGSPASAAADVLAPDSRTALRLHGSAASALADVLATDTTRIGARLGGSPAATAADVLAADLSTGLRLAGSPAGVLADALALADVGGVRFGVSPASTLSSGGAADVQVSAAPGGVRLGGSPATVAITEVVHDQMVMPILTQAQGCLITEVGKLANPPSLVQIRPGRTFTAMLGPSNDECCSGIAWVRPGDQTPTTGNWPTAAVDPDKNPTTLYAVQIELGIMRCIPTGADTGDPNDPPTGAQWLAAAQDQMDDGAALRRVICCLRDIYGNDAVLAGPIGPLENDANCGGITVVLTIRAAACDCFG